MENHLSSNLTLLDAAVKAYMNLQITDERSPYLGGEYVFDKQFPDVVRGATATFIMGYYTPGSPYYHQELMLDRALLGSEYYLKWQHEDGSVDLFETNFHDCCESAFVLRVLVPAVKVLCRFNTHTPKEDQLEANLLRFIRGSGDSMLTNGFGTPNHRWVLCAALSLCYALLGDQKYLDMIHRYLNEGIDCDENGEYTERSAGCYNIACDMALMTVATELNMPELYDHVTRNLNMSMHYFEPDNSICCLNSNRQDVGYQVYMDIYYPVFLHMARKTGNAKFAWMADYTQKLRLARVMEPDWDPIAYIETIYPYADMLLSGSTEQELAAIPVSPVEFRYERMFENSGAYRYRDGDLSLTVIKGRPGFAQLKYKNHQMILRAAGSFFGRGQFLPQEMTAIEGGCRLHCHTEYSYFSVLEEKPDTWDWNKMDHSKRKPTNRQYLDMYADVVMKDGKLTVTFRAEGCDYVPMKLEFLLDAGGLYETGDTELFAKAGDYVFWKQGGLRYSYPDTAAFCLEGGFHAHHYGANMRYTAAQDQNAFTVNATAFTPMDQTVTIEVKEGC